MELKVNITSTKSNWHITVEKQKIIIKEYFFIGNHIYETILDLLKEYKNKNIVFYKNNKKIDLLSMQKEYNNLWN